MNLTYSLKENQTGTNSSAGLFSEQKKEDGIYVILDGLSPVAIPWTKIDEKAIGSLPQTGDTERPLLYGLIALLACIGIGWMTKKK